MKTLEDTKKSIEKTKIQIFLDEILKIDRIYTMYDTLPVWLSQNQPDALNNKYRIQIFLANGEEFKKDDFKKVLVFMYGFMDSFQKWTQFENLFAEEVMDRLQTLPKDSSPIYPYGDEEQKTKERELYIESLQREQRKPFEKPAQHKRKSLEYLAAELEANARPERQSPCFISPNHPYQVGDLWANPKMPESDKDAKIWEHLKKSLALGFGTVGFEDFYGGICLRGGFIELKNGQVLETSFSRSNLDRYHEKKRTIERILQNEFQQDLDQHIDLASDTVRESPLTSHSIFLPPVTGQTELDDEVLHSLLKVK